MKLLTETDRYQAIHKLVLEVCNLSELPEEYSDPEANRWINIIFVCDDYSGYEDCELFYAAVHKIRWGQYPDRGYPDAFKELIDLVVTELLRDGEAFGSWCCHETLHAALADAEEQKKADCVDGPRCFSLAHLEFLCGQMYYDVLYSKRSVAEASGLDEDIDIDFFKFREYKKIVTRLIPGAVTWGRAEWADERRIYAELLQLYGADYLDCPASYSKLIDLLYELWSPIFDDGEELISISDTLGIQILPEALVKKILPGVSSDELADLFLKFFTNVQSSGLIRGNNPVPVYPFKTEQDILKDSWLTKLVLGWIGDGYCYGSNPLAVKKAAFNIIFT